MSKAAAGRGVVASGPDVMRDMPALHPAKKRSWSSAGFVALALGRPEGGKGVPSWTLLVSSERENSPLFVLWICVSLAGREARLYRPRALKWWGALVDGRVE